MNVSSVAASAYAARIASGHGSIYRSTVDSGTPAAAADSVSISLAAQAAFAASSAGATSSAESGEAASVEARLAEIRSKGVVNRSAEDTAYLWANDKKLAEITAKGKSSDQLTASELDYVQKATGFVNTMACLSPAEKALYDKAVASGNTQAAAGLAQVAMIRTMGHVAGGSSGTTYDPIDTAITAANVAKYFSHTIVDPSGDAAAKFQALIEFLNSNPTTA